MGNLPCNLHLHHHTWQGTHSCTQGRCWHTLAQYHQDTVCCILNDIASIKIVTFRLRSKFSCTKDTKPQSRNYLWHVYYTVCTRSSDPFYIVIYHIKRVTPSWTDGIYKEPSIYPNHPWQYFLSAIQIEIHNSYVHVKISINKWFLNDLKSFYFFYCFHK